ncbi:MAG: AfsR/SARP family transcriptional regulator, partial [Geminicoccaceae bacterium]
MPHLHLSLLGGFECRKATGELLHFPTRKVRALFAYLAVSAGHAHRRDKLAGLLWGDRDEAQARSNLRKAVSRLRTSLPDEVRGCLVADAGQVALRPDGIEVDVSLFARYAADGTPEALERAAVLCRGAFLADFADCGEEFEAWLMPERRRLDET